MSRRIKEEKSPDLATADRLVNVAIELLSLSQELRGAKSSGVHEDRGDDAGKDDAGKDDAGKDDAGKGNAGGSGLDPDGDIEVQAEPEQEDDGGTE